MASPFLPKTNLLVLLTTFSWIHCDFLIIKMLREVQIRYSENVYIIIQTHQASIM